MNKRHAGIFIVALVAFANVGHADLITFSKANLAADGSNLDNSGTLLVAPNFSENPAPANATFSLNGVGFQGVAYSSSASGPFWAMGSNRLEGAGRTSGLTIADAAFPLVERAWWDGGDRTLALSGLTEGSQYRLQVIFTTDSTRDAILTNGDDPTNSSGAQLYGPDFGPALMTAEWTETGTTQNIVIDRVSQAPVVAGFTLHLVPEPTSFALVGLGLLCFAGGYRRRQERISG